MIEKLEVIVDTEKNSAEIIVEMSGTNLIIAAGRILALAAKESGIDIEILAMSLVHTNARKPIGEPDETR